MNPFFAIHNIVIWTKWDPLGHILGTKWALVFGKLVPFFAKYGIKVGRSRDFCYYAILIEFLWVSYAILIEFYKNYWVNMLIIFDLGA